MLVLFGIRLYQRLSAQTHVRFTVAVSGQPGWNSGQMDGRPYTSGERVSLGKHQLVFTHPKGKTVTTNFSVWWFGEHNLGTITLSRQTGIMVVHCQPPATAVTVIGPEWTTNLANVSLETLTVPTDEYTLKSYYPYDNETKTYVVDENHPDGCTFAPAQGVLHASFNRVGGQYELRWDGHPSFLEHGDLPMELTGLPVGQYQLRATYHGLTREQSVVIANRQTNQLDIEFSLGNVSFSTTPSGATVSDEHGHMLGVTPLALTDLSSGVWRGEVALPDYQPVPVAVEVLEKQTVNFQTNLLRRSFATALALANQWQPGGNCVPLIEALSAALKDDPDNAQAAAMLKKCQAFQSIASGTGKMRSGDYAGGLLDAEDALATLPDNADARRLVADCKAGLQAQQAKAEADRQQAAETARLNRPSDYFNELMRKTRDSADFAEQVVTLQGNVADLRQKISDGFSKSLMLRFAIETNATPFEGGFMIRCKESMPIGFRRVYLVGSQSGEGQVTVRFKVFEYTWPADVMLSALISKPSEDKAISLSQSTISPNVQRDRRDQGIQIVTDRIKDAAAP